jgi:hypothetical protein
MKVSYDYYVQTMIFVFGSNTEGRHGAGAALSAVKQYGAIYGQASGRQGNSYGIVTKDLAKGKRSIPLSDIKLQVVKFIAYAKEHSHLQFIVTPIGCGLAGYDIAEIAPMFANAPSNVQLPQVFVKYYEYLEDMRIFPKV